MVLQAVLDELGEQQHGVVVAPLGAADQLAGLVQQGGDLRHAEGAQQGEAERHGVLFGEVVAQAQAADLSVVPRGVQRPDASQHSVHGLTPRG